jgi:cellulose synthase operon protein C
MNNSFKLSLLALLITSSLMATGCKKADTPEGQIAEAKKALEVRDLRNSEIHLRNLLQKNPDHPEGHYLLGKLYFSAGDFRGSEKEFRRAVELSFDRNLAVPPLLESLLQLGQQQAVLDDSQNMAVDQPAAKAEVLNAQGRALLAIGKRELASAKFEESIAAKNDFVPAYVSRIQMTAIGGDKQLAYTQVDELIGKYPESGDALGLKGDLLLTDGKLAEARDFYAKVVKVKPTDVMTRAKYAAILIDLQDYPSAKLELTELTKLSPASPGTLHLKALYEFRNNNLTQAQEFIQAAVRVAPDYLPATSLAGNIFLASNQLERAERAGRTLVDRQPNALQGYRLLAATYLKMNQPERALQTVQPLLDKGVEDATLLAIAGEATLKSNDPSKAASYFERSIKIDPKDAGKRTGLALSRLATGQKDQGFAELETAVGLDSQSFQADFALIMARMRDKQYDKALEAVLTLEKKQPNNPVPLNLRGMILTAKNQFPEARSSFEQAVKLDAGFFPAAANLASLDLRDNKPEDAKKRYESVLVKDPKNYQAHIALARHAARYGGKKEDIIAYLQKGKTNNPGAIPPVLALATYLVDNNNAKDAVTVLQESLQQNPEKPELLDLLGMAFLRLNERGQALETYDRMLKQDPNSAALHYRMGELKVALRDENGALTSFRRSAELQPKALEPQIAMASVLLRQGKKDEARKIATTLQKDLPNSPAGQILSADLFMAEQNYPEALNALKKAIAVENSPQTSIKMFNAYQKMGNTAESEKIAVSMAKDFGDDLGVRLFLGEQAIAAKRWADAIDHYKFALKRDSANGVALNNMAWALFQIKDPKALQVAELAYSTMPQSPSVMDTLGYIAMQTGNVPKGLEMLRQASAMAPKAADIRLHLAEALAKSNDKEAARKEAEAALKEGSGTPIAEQAKAFIGTL